MTENAFKKTNGGNRYGPLIGALDEGTSSVRFLVKKN